MADTQAPQALHHLARQFVDQQDAEKFTVLQSLCYFLNTFGEGADLKPDLVPPSGDQKDPHWSTLVRKGVFDILTNRVEPSALEDALLLCHWMLQPSHVGGAWALPDLPPVLLQICRTEISMHLGGYERTSEQVELVSEDDDQEPFLPSDQAQGLLISCYQIVEDSIFHLVQGDDENPPAWINMAPHNLQQMQIILGDIGTAWVQFLSRFHSSPLQRHPFVLATLKVLGVWVGEDPEPLQNEFVQCVAPLVISLCAEEKPFEVRFQALEFVLPAFISVESLFEPLAAPQRESLVGLLFTYLIEWGNHHDVMDCFEDEKILYAKALLEDYPFHTLPATLQKQRQHPLLQMLLPPGN